MTLRLARRPKPILQRGTRTGWPTCRACILLLDGSPADVLASGLQRSGDEVSTAQRAGLYCEQCGTHVGLDASQPDARYCLGCGLFVGPECWNASIGRCTGCIPIGSETEHRPELVGITAASRAIDALERLPDEAAALAIAESELHSSGRGDASRLAQLELERALLWVRADDVAAAASRALASFAPRYLVSANKLRARSDAVLHRLATTGLPALSVEPEDEGTPVFGELIQRFVGHLRRAAAPGSNGLVPAIQLLTGLAVVALVALALLTRPAENQTRGSAAGDEPISRGQVAGGGASPRPLGPRGGPQGPEEIAAFPFDELVMGSSLGPPWQITKDSGSVAVNPFPNAIERSLLLRTDSRGPVTICHPVDARQDLRATQASVDIYRPADGSAGAVTIQSAIGVWGISIGPLGEVGYREKDGEPRASAIRLETGRWYRLSIAFGAVPGEYSLTIADPSAAGGVTSHGPLPANVDAEPMQLCIASAGEPNAELYLDNVVIKG
jgi:hypothetical protein